MENKKNSSALELLRQLQKEKQLLVDQKRILKPKPTAPLNEDELPYALPDYWIWVRLNDVSIIQEGPGIRKSQYSNEGVQFLTVTNILEGEVDLEKSKKYISEKEYSSKYKHFTINKGDIVSSCSGATWGKTAIFESDELLILNTSTLRLRFFGDKADNKFLYYLTKTDFFKNQLSEHLTGQQPNYGYYHYSLIAIPLPPLSEQQHIVAVLDEAFPAIDQANENIERNIENTKELFQSQLYSIIHSGSERFENSTVGKSCAFFNGKAHEKAIDENGNFIVVNSRFISTDGRVYKRTAEQMFPLFTGDVVMVMSDVPNGKALAKCFLIDEDKKYSLNQRICAIRSDRFEKKYLLYQLNRHKHLLSFNNGENQTNLRKDDILNTPLIVPPMEEQRKVIAKLDELKEMTNQVISNYQQKLNALEELKKSILQKAFTGKLTSEKNKTQTLYAIRNPSTTCTT